MRADEILTDCLPAVWRVAHALGGSTRAGRTIVQTVVGQSLTAMPAWRRDTPPLQWFYHHTVLAARAHQDVPPDPAADTLVEHIAPDPAYTAFVRALRLLPRQQREAYLLHHGEHLDDRFLGIAMDCSTGAARTHLAAASAALAKICHGDIDAMRDSLSVAYQALTPEQVNVGSQITALTARANFRRFVRSAFRITRSLILLGAIAAAAWYFRATLAGWYELARSMQRPVETQPATTQ
jgi:DNA-directed RNA polymerase specialized sigma24 family protein